jgi:putative membrane protein
MNFHLPSINASLNAMASLFLIVGWVAIRSGKKRAHQVMMIMAVLCSALFLSCYLYYHWSVPGVTRYQGEGFSRIVYFFILATHTPLAVLIVPFIIKALLCAFRKDFARHMAITRWLLPVWLYVSVTGVLIYFMLYG